MVPGHRQRLWCFLAALEDVAVAATQQGSMQSGHSRGRHPVFSRVQPAPLQVGPGLEAALNASPSAAAPLDQIRRHYTAWMKPEPAAEAQDASMADGIATLALKTFSSDAELKSLRRSFAMRNHPDRVPASLRAQANRNMAMVNAFVDAELSARMLALGA